MAVSQFNNYLILAAFQIKQIVMKWDEMRNYTVDNYHIH